MCPHYDNILANYLYVIGNILANKQQCLETYTM